MNKLFAIFSCESLVKSLSLAIRLFDRCGIAERQFISFQKMRDKLKTLVTPNRKNNICTMQVNFCGVVAE